MIYLAGPFFNAFQLSDQVIAERLCAVHKLEFHSPRLSMVLPKDAPEALCQKVFLENVTKIEEASLVLANIEGRDTGTMIELGFAYRAGIPVVAYSLNPERRMNVMMKCLVAGFCNSEKEIDDFLSKWRTGQGVIAKQFAGEVE